MLFVAIFVTAQAYVIGLPPILGWRIYVCFMKICECVWPAARSLYLRFEASDAPEGMFISLNK